ncbi:MAG TPA: nuclear transport factor 2 family protein [Pirellulales bacterium]|jgi:uncharacterized protein (TIGR02246 family)|nr:nuclear transport factor 2 family protein [Pirellulales bacterium]
MRWRSLLFLLVPALLGSLVFLSSESAARDPVSREQDEQAIRAATKQYLAALERGDPKELAGFWVADGDVVDALGNSHPARELIGKRAEAAEEGARPKVKATGSTIRLLTPDVAIEDGTSEVIHAEAEGSPSSRGRFTAIWVKQDEKWRLASLREARVEPPATAAQLADLDGMVGEWIAQNKESVIEVSAAWNPTRTFLVRELRVLNQSEVAFNIVQRIGWDPLAGKIKSWNFDSDGSYGDGVWTKAGNSWIVQATGVRGDGSRTSSTNVYTFDGKDSFTWKSTVGNAAPELNVVFVRKSTGK